MSTCFYPVFVLSENGLFCAAAVRSVNLVKKAPNADDPEKIS